jgi:hypothetical protein
MPEAALAAGKIGLALMFSFCSSPPMSTRTLHDPGLAIPPRPVAVRFVPARPPARIARRMMRDFTGFLAIAWAVAEIALWAGGA